MAGVHSLGGGEGVGHQGVVRREGYHIHAGYLGIGVAEVDAVKVVVHGVPADHQVCNVQIIAQGAGNAGVHQMGDGKAGAEDLGAQRGIDLAHAALDDDGGQAVQCALVKGASCNFLRSAFGHGFHQSFNLLGHGTDNSEFCHDVLLIPDK